MYTTSTTTTTTTTTTHTTTDNDNNDTNNDDDYTHNIHMTSRININIDEYSSDTTDNSNRLHISDHFHFTMARQASLPCALGTVHNDNNHNHHNTDIITDSIIIRWL